MAPKRIVGKKPKAVQGMQDAIVADGQPITADSIAAQSYDKRKAAFTAFASMLKDSFPSQYQMYKDYKNDRDKREHLARLMVDPMEGGAIVTNNTERSVDNSTQGNEQWLHESQIAGPQFLNDARMAQVLCESGDLQDRPSELPSLAARGFKQYYFSWSLYQNTISKRQIVGASCSGSVDADQYKEVVDSMVAPINGFTPHEGPSGQGEADTQQKK